MKAVLLVLAAYLLGSIPFSYLFSQLRGKDPRNHGSKNVGATNTLVIAGRLAGGLALIGDLGKGALAVLLARYANLPDGAIALSGLLAVIGHDFSVFLRFRGGKGVATTGGVLFALDPIFTLIIILFWVLSMLLIRRFIPGTVLTMVFIPVIMWMASWKKEYVLFGAANAALGIYSHRFDLRRFFAGEELAISESLAKYRGK